MRPVTTLLLVFALGLAACSDGADPVDDDRDRSTSGQSLPVAEESGTEVVVAALADLQAERRAAAEVFEDGLATGRPLIPLTIDLFDADRRSAGDAVRVIPDDASTTDAVAGLVTATRALAEDAADIHADLVALDEQGTTLPASAIDLMIEGHRDVLRVWRDACFAFVDAVDGPVDIDCIGLPQPPDAPRADGVDVRIECEFGEQLASLPFDTSPYAWLQDPAIADNAWLYSKMHIDNTGDEPVQLWTGQRIRYLDAAGEVVAELPSTEVVDVAYRAAAGQRVVRTGLTISEFTFPVQVRASEYTDTDVAAVFDRATSCELAEPVHVVTVEPADTAPSENGATAGEVRCERLDDEGIIRYEVEVTNGGDEDRVFDVGVEIVDAGGDRLGLTGSPVAVAAGATEVTSSQSVLYTVDRADEFASCRIVRLEAIPWD